MHDHVPSLIRRPALAIVVAVVVGLSAACAGSGSDPGTATPPTTTARPSGAVAASVAWGATLSGPTNEDDIDGVAAAPDGSAYLTGKFEQTAVLGGVDLRSQGLADIPMARFSPSGEVQWVKRFGGPDEDNLFDIDADANGAVGTGIFQGVVDFGDVTLDGAGASDCVVVAVDPDGRTRWARSFGGPGPDGCNEVVVAPDGSVVTSLDTAGGWDSPAGVLEPGDRDTLLLKLDADGALLWADRVGGPRAQRGKSLAVGPDGSIAFGGDTQGPIVVDGVEHGGQGRGKDAWVGHWTADGDRSWVQTWGGPGDDLAKGVAYTDAGIYAVGPVTGSVDIGGATISARAESDTAVVHLTPDGSADWVTTVSASNSLVGAEITAAADGGIVFGGPAAPDLTFGQVIGAPQTLDEADDAAAWVVHYRPDGTVGLLQTIAGTVDARPGELDRVGDRLYLDLTVRGGRARVGAEPIVAQGKDSSVWALDLTRPQP